MLDHYLWWPYNQVGLDKQMETIQINFLKKIKGLKDIPYTDQLSKCKLLSMKRKQEYTMTIWTFKNIQNGRFKTNKTLRRGQFVIYEPLKGKVHRFKTLYWNSVFNMGPRIYNSLPKSIRGLRCDYIFFEIVLKHFLHNIVPNDGNPILQYLPNYSDWSIPISLGKTYWDSKLVKQNKRNQLNETQEVLHNKRIQSVQESWRSQFNNILGEEINS